MVAQRLETIRLLNLFRGDRVLDIGCGPGFLCESMAKIVGPKGTVVGIDISTDLIDLCNQRKVSKHLSVEIGDATKLSQSNGSFDAAVCTQVAEYIVDVDRVFSETFRILKPNGRTVFVATDWSTILWHSDNPKRMAAIMKSWQFSVRRRAKAMVKLGPANRVGRVATANQRFALGHALSSLYQPWRLSSSYSLGVGLLGGH